MNRETVENNLKLNGWKKIKDYPYPKAQHIGEIYILNGFIAYHYNYYLVVNGKMPLTQAELMFDKYDNDKVLIRVDGGCEDCTPESWATHDKIKDFSGNIDFSLYMAVEGGLASIDEEFKQLKRDLLKSDRKNFYVETYHIDTEVGIKIISNVIKGENVECNLL